MEHTSRRMERGLKTVPRRGRLGREARVLASLKHPGILRYIEHVLPSLDESGVEQYTIINNTNSRPATGATPGRPGSVR